MNSVGFAPSDRFRVATNVGYVTGPTHLPCEAGCGGYVWTTLFATPNNYNNESRHGFHSWLPYQYDKLVQIWQDLERTTASVRFEHQPRTWLSHRMIIGGDRTREGNNWLQPRMDSLQYQAGSGTYSLARLSSVPLPSAAPPWARPRASSRKLSTLTMFSKSTGSSLS